MLALYDIDNPDGPDHDFYRSLADRNHVGSVLDVGCGTGILTVTLARDDRQVAGVDPSSAMLGWARRRPGTEGVEWVQGESSAAPAGPFDMTVMTGNVAQHIPDGAWFRTLLDIRERMVPGGLLAFETRDPARRAWEAWDSEPATTRETPVGVLTEWSEATCLDDRTVHLFNHVQFQDTGQEATDPLVLVFRSHEEVVQDLCRAGFEVEAVYGDWEHTPFDAECSTGLMVFMARAAAGGNAVGTQLTPR